jgi:hypothetical protein
VIQYLKARRIVLPTAHFLINAITYAFRHFEERLCDALQKSLHPEDTILLDRLLDDVKTEGSAIYRLSKLKRVNQKTQPSRAIRSMTRSRRRYKER